MISEKLKTQLESKINSINKKAEDEIKALVRDAVFSNAKYKIGDIITSPTKSIEVTKIKYSMSGFLFSKFNPQAVYYGYTLTKQMKRRKDEKISCIYENDDLNAF